MALGTYAKYLFMKKDNYLPIKLTEVQYEFINTIAKKLQVNKSEALRKIIDIGLNNKQYWQIEELLNNHKEEKDNQIRFYKTLIDFILINNLKFNEETFHYTIEFLLYLKNTNNIRQ